MQKKLYHRLNKLSSKLAYVEANGQTRTGKNIPHGQVLEFKQDLFETIVPIISNEFPTWVYKADIDYDLNLSSHYLYKAQSRIDDIGA